jgi:hypothetical protein
VAGPPLPLEFDRLTNRQVLQRVNEIAEELARRGLIQSLTSSPAGGYTEHIVARHFGTKPLQGQDDGFDLVRPDTGARVQVKARRHGPDKKKTHFGDFGLLEQRRFDEFVGVVFAYDWSVDEAWQIPWEAVDALAHLVQDKHRLYFTDIRRWATENKGGIEAFDLRDED